VIKAVLFDLDGTLLPMDQDEFIKAYFGALVKKLTPFGYDSSLVGAIWKGTEAMVKNDGSRTNEDRWWETFCSIYGDRARDDEAHLDNFYQNEFELVRQSCGFTPDARKIVDLCHERGFRVILATNPVFPRVATMARIRWAGLDFEDFELVTTYENSTHCKPNPKYYTEILEKTGLDASECLMVGNDAREDGVARTLGMDVFLLTPCLINKDGVDISSFPHGTTEDLIRYIGEIV
jgi:FMN phosphatase YigB (HAD superfamily)